MAIKEVINIEVNNKSAIDNINKQAQATKGLKEETTGLTEGATSGAQGASKSVTNLGKSFSAAGLALKGMGIGLILGLLDRLVDAFKSNQTAVDLFTTAGTALNKMFQDLFSFIGNGYDKVVGWFKGIFSDPKQAIIDFGNAIKENLIERFNSFIKTLGLVSKSIRELLAGKFSDAWDTAKEAMQESLDVLTGINNTGKKLGDLADSVADYAKETWNSAKALTELNNQSKIAEAQNARLLQQYDRQAEKQRQLRDDESKSIQDRIKANNDLGAVLDKQEKAMVANANIMVRRAQLELQMNNTIENRVALIQALTEKDDVLATVEGFRSEQLVNQIALQKELNELNQTAIDGANERAIKQLEQDRELSKSEWEKFYVERQILEERKRLADEQWAIDQERYKEGTQAYADAQQAKLNADQEYQLGQEMILNKELELQQKRAEELVEIEKWLADEKVRIQNEALDALSSIAGEETKLGQIVYLAKQAMLVKEQVLSIKAQLMKAKEAAQNASLKALEAGVDTQAGVVKTASSAPFPANIGLVAGYVGMALPILATVISAVRKIKGAKSDSGGGAVSSSGGSSATQNPSFNLIQGTGANQIAETIASQDQVPIQAYVVSSAVSSAQALDRNIVGESEL